MDPVPEDREVTAAAVAATAASTAADASTQAAKTAAATSATSATETAAGRRRINIIWETTQAFLAVEIVTAILYIAVRDGDLPTSLGVLAATVLATYFTRTNHTRIGGVGPEPSHEAGRRGE